MIKLCLRFIYMIVWLVLRVKKSEKTVGNSKWLQWMCVHGVYGLQLCFGQLGLSDLKHDLGLSKSCLGTVYRCLGCQKHVVKSLVAIGKFRSVDVHPW